MLAIRGVETLGGFSSWHRSIDNEDTIECSKLPVNLGFTPIGLKAWYKNPPPETFVFFDDDRRDICPMKGSKRGIGLSSYDKRIYAYDYKTAEKLGRRFGSWCRKTGKRFLVMTGEMERLPGQCQEIRNQEFIRGAIFGLCDKENYYDISESERLLDENRCFSFASRNGVTVFINMAGTFEQAKRMAIMDIAYEILETGKTV